jgi:hypothetical protein
LLTEFNTLLTGSFGKINTGNYLLDALLSHSKMKGFMPFSGYVSPALKHGPDEMNSSGNRGSSEYLLEES